MTILTNYILATHYNSYTLPIVHGNKYWRVGWKHLILLKRIIILYFKRKKNVCVPLSNCVLGFCHVSTRFLQLLRKIRSKKRPSPRQRDFFHPGHPSVQSTGIFVSSSLCRHQSFPIKSHYYSVKLKGAHACFSISQTKLAAKTDMLCYAAGHSRTQIITDRGDDAEYRTAR